MQILLYSSLVLLLLLAPGVAQGQLEVSILDYPKYIYTYEPIYITYEVRNIGAQPEVTPIGECRDHGVYLEASIESVKGGEYRSIWPLSHCDYRLRSLAPGERYLRHESWNRVGVIEGVVRFRAFARSSGVCEDQPGRAEELGTQPIPPMMPVSTAERFYVPPQKYVCWQGEAYSEPISVEIRVPDGEQDRAVREWLGYPPRELQRYKDELVERFPESQYTYAELVRWGNYASLERAMRLQPGNPLNRHVLGYWAFKIISRSGPCVEDYALEPLAMPISELAVSEPVKAWLEQEKQRAIDECPEVLERRRLHEEYQRRRGAQSDDDPD